MPKFNKQQETFINAPLDKAIRVLAGPGSGKTTSLVLRIAFLLSQGVNPDAVIAVTFSKSMADELTARIQKVSPNANARQISTIHAMAYRMLRAEGDTREPAADRKAFLVKKNAKMSLEQTGIPEIGYKEFLQYLGNAKFNAVRHNQLEEFYTRKIEEAGGLQKQVNWKWRAPELLADASILYDNMMKQDHVLTFNDMICEVEWMLEDRLDVLRRYQEKWEYIFVDEAQDTSRQAMRILSKLAAPQDKFTVVGDADQTIFRFAGAAPEDNLWEGFELRFPNHLTYKLETNYRSTSSIVDFTNRSILANYNETTEQYRKTLVPRPDAEEGKLVDYEVYKDAAEEAKAISDRIADEMYDDGYAPGNFFVAFRTRAQAAYLYGALFRNKIPFVDKCGGSFWDAAHVQDLIAYLKLSANVDDDDAFLRIYNKASVDMKQQFDVVDRATNKLVRARGAHVSHRWLGKAFLEQCGNSYTGINMVRDQKFQVGISDLRETVRRIQEAKNPADKVSMVVDYVLRSWWAAEEGEADENDEGGRAADFVTILDLAKNYETLSEFLEYIAEMVKISRDAIAGDESKVVILSTVHRIKGMERKITYVAGVMEGLLPHSAALGNYGSSDSILPFKNCTTVEDERRLFFVACSRAKELLHLTGCYNYQNKILTKSRFAREVGLVDESNIESVIADVVRN